MSSKEGIPTCAISNQGRTGRWRPVSISLPNGLRRVRSCSREAVRAAPVHTVEAKPPFSLNGCTFVWLVGEGVGGGYRVRVCVQVRVRVRVRVCGGWCAF